MLESDITSFTWQSEWLQMFPHALIVIIHEWMSLACGHTWLNECWNGSDATKNLCVTYELLMNSRWIECSREYRAGLSVPAVWISNSGLLINSRWNNCSREYRTGLSVPAVWIDNPGFLEVHVETYVSVIAKYPLNLTLDWLLPWVPRLHCECRGFQINVHDWLDLRS